MQAYGNDMARIFPALGALVIIAIVLAFSLIGIIAWCMIWKRAGYSWALGLLMLVPLVNFVAFLILAFSKWPVERDVERLRGR